MHLTHTTCLSKIETKPNKNKKLLKYENKMVIEKLDQIVEEARKRGKRRLAVAYGQDSHTIEAVYNAYKEGIVEPTLY